MAATIAYGDSRTFWQTKQGEDIIDAEFSVVGDRALPAPEKEPTAPTDVDGEK
jgi:hypothetical protein